MTHPVDRCRSCGARIVWGTLADGKRIPLNATRVRVYQLADGAAVEHTTPDGRPFLGYVSHFVSCVNASAHSKGGR